ncbi:MAG: response regulator [Bryobacterales bacterium]|nr:response regulator [Bryobacterales bacterium]
MKRVLIVEDQEANRALLREYVHETGAMAVDVGDGLAALNEIHAQPPDLVILDLRLPRMDGITVLRRVRENPELKRLPIVVVSALSELDKVSQCIELGAIDFLPKPFKPAVIRARLQSYLNRRRFHAAGEQPDLFPRHFARQVVASLELWKSSPVGQQLGFSDALFHVLEQFNPETRGHLERMAGYCELLLSELSRNSRHAEALDAKTIQHFLQSASLHDIGKLAVPDWILSKPGPLTPEEHRVMRRHVTVGGEILRELQVLFPHDARLGVAIDMALYHHERWDGAGYPFGLSGEAIPLPGRIMALADVYDALTSERCYKAAFSHQDSRDIIVGAAGKQFDSAVVSAFLACEAEFKRISQHALEEGERHDADGKNANGSNGNSTASSSGASGQMLKYKTMSA